MNIFEWIKQVVRPCKPCRVTTDPAPPKRATSVEERISRAWDIYYKCDKVGRELGRIGDRWVVLRDRYGEIWWKDEAGFEWDDDGKYWFTTDINKAMDVAPIEDHDAGLFTEYDEKIRLRHGMTRNRNPLYPM